MMNYRDTVKRKEEGRGVDFALHLSCIKSFRFFTIYLSIIPNK
jgi:hypothetical protein